MRLYEILRRALLSAGGRLMLGAEVVSHTRADGRLRSVNTRAAGHDVTYEADWFVLASGGFASGGIELDSHWVTHERVLELPLAGVPEAGSPRFVAGYLDEQPLARAGVAVDSELRCPELANVLVAGAALPGATPWREGSGEGLALGSGFKAAAVISAGRPTRKEALA
jgi:glycerol-3-phosphate dehydrogenase subunit B